MFERTRRLIQTITGRRKPAVAVLRLDGVIGMRTGFGRTLSLPTIAADIDRLFADKDVAACAIIINSPGGSPVQSALIHDRIREKADKTGLRVLAFTEDVAASGGYMLALAGDEIHAHGSSIIGSIGVISAGFGYQELLGRIGVERRVHTSGNRKSMLDPFRPENPDDVKHLKELQAEIHESFKAMVRTRRAGKLKGNEDELFSGSFWTGSAAAKFGLVDGTGDLRAVCRAKFGDDVEYRLVQPRRSWFGGGRLSVAAPSPAAGWSADLAATLEERAHWARFGL